MTDKEWVYEGNLTDGVTGKRLYARMKNGKRQTWEGKGHPTNPLPGDPPKED